MKIIKYKCDYCGKEIQNEVEAFLVGHMAGEEFVPAVADAFYHYHAKCLEDILNRKKKPATQKKDLDMDQILSLRDAGWTLEKIGDEFGVSAQTVANRLKEAQK